MRPLPFLIASLALAPLAAGCSFHLGSSTQGNQNQATFSYGSCLFGCSVDEPMMLGTQESIHVTAPDIPVVTVSSSDETVIAVHGATRTCCDQANTCRTIDATVACNANETTTALDFTADTKAVGTADLVLRAADATVFDSVTLTVARAQSLSLQCDNAPGPVSLRAGDTCGLGWTALDAQGRALMASTGVNVATDSADVAELRELFGQSTPSLVATQGFLGTSVVGIAPGDATISASVGEAKTSIVVHVTQ
jgi:hypothetical protein